MLGSGRRRIGGIVAIVIGVAGLLIFGVVYLSTRYSRDLGLRYSEHHEEIYWGSTTYVMNWAETQELERRSGSLVFNDMSEKFISIIDGTRGFRAFKIRGVSEQDWIVVFSQDDGRWFLYQRKGGSEDFPLIE